MNIKMQILNGDSEKHRSCLVQAEKFISINGFGKSIISQKRRSLHHCYAYMRIMAETTCIADGLSEKLTNTSILSEDDAPSAEFRISSDIIFSENILAEEKDPSVAQRDLHLAIPGRWSLTLFPEMYGVAESFLMLLSQVIRLANERDFSMLYQTGSGSLNLRDFWLRAKTLEKGINILLSSCTSESNHDYDSETEADNPRAQAMYTALLIFFHRRIYDLDATMLQREVNSVCSFLTSIQQDEAGRRGESMATLIWPAFIAACEAVDSTSQAFFSQWFDTCSTATALVNASVAKSIIETIWAKRQEMGLNKNMCTWPEVLRAKKIRLMCT
jgi:arginine metabolism regulation protein II